MANRSVAAADSREFAVLASRHLPRLYRYAFRLCGGADGAADLVQEAMVKAFRSRGSYDPSRPILPWLLAFVRNTSIDIRRSFDPLRDSGGADPDTLDNPGSAGTDPLAGADSEERRAAVEKALANLPVDQRSTVVLFYMEGLSLEEVAAAEGVAVGTVKSRLFRAREHLAELLVRFRT